MGLVLEYWQVVCPKGQESWNSFHIMMGAWFLTQLSPKGCTGLLVDRARIHLSGHVGRSVRLVPVFLVWASPGEWVLLRLAGLGGRSVHIRATRPLTVDAWVGERLLLDSQLGTSCFWGSPSGVWCVPLAGLLQGSPPPVPCSRAVPCPGRWTGGHVSPQASGR